MIWSLVEKKDADEELYLAGRGPRVKQEKIAAKKKDKKVKK